MSFEGLSREALVARLEALLAQRGPATADDHDRLVHEFQVHQEELEVQNRDLREAQSALEASRSRYADLYDFAPVAYCTLDDKGCVLEANLTAATMLGKDRAGILGLPFAALVRLADPPLFWAHLRRCAQTRAPVASELVFSPVGREAVQVEAVSVPVLGVAGRPVAFRTAFSDIGERKRAEVEARRLHGEEQRLRRLFEALDHAGLAISRALASMPLSGMQVLLQTIADETRLLAGARYAAIGVGGASGEPFARWVFSGMTAEEAGVVGRHPSGQGVLARVVHDGRSLRLPDLRQDPAFIGFPPHHPPMTSLLAVPVRFGERVLGTIYLTDKLGGGEFTVDDQRVVEMLAFRAGISLEVARLTDHEARKQARLVLLAAASQSLASLSSVELHDAVSRVARLVVPTLADACLVYEVDGPEELRLTVVAHRDPDKERALSQRQVVLRLDAEGPDGPLTRAARSRKPELLVAPPPSEGRQLQGSELPEDLSPTSIICEPLVARDRLCGVMCFVHAESGRHHDPDDVATAELIASRYALASENARLYETAQSAVRSRENLLAVVSHDLRSPLSVVAITAERFLRTFGHDSKAQRYATIIARNVERMDRLIADLLTATSIEVGGLKVAVHRQETSAVIDEAFQQAEPLVEAKALRFERLVATGLPAVLCDRERVLRVFSNLVGNALKFTPAGGRIRLEAAMRGAELCFSVADSGPGIPASDQARLFDRFWKGSSDGTQGIGLGLYIAKGIVEAHRGKLWVESTPGDGTTFLFTLPVAPPAG